jgi:hypothetical protein
MLNMFKPPTQPESDSLSSDWRIAEVNLSGTRQNKLCRVPLSTNNDARHIPLCWVQNTRHTLTLGKGVFTGCQALDETWRTTKGRQQSSMIDDRYLCRVSGIYTR